MLDTDWGELTKKLRQAKLEAAQHPGRYGGRYVGRRWNKRTKRSDFLILDDDDPDKIPADVDVLAIAKPDVIHPLGGAGRFIQPDGTIDFGDGPRE